MWILLGLFCLAIMASLTTQPWNFNVGSNNRPTCRTINCEKLAKPNCAALGYCSYSCSLLGEKVNPVVDVSELPPCALLGCNACVKPKKPYWKPFCCWSCQDKFEKLLQKMVDYPGDSMRCPLCGWEHYKCEEYSAADWMSWHMTKYHSDGGPAVFAKNVQMACETWFPDREDPPVKESLLVWFQRAQQASD